MLKPKTVDEYRMGDAGRVKEYTQNAFEVFYSII